MSSSHAVRIRMAPWALLAVSAAWGLSFVVMKDPIAKESVNSFLFTRFVVAVLAMVALRPAILQTLGLARAGAAVTGFITGLYVVATPLIAAIVLKAKISRFTWGCVALATAGLALLSIKGWSMGVGEILVFGCAIAFGAHIVTLGHWSNGLDSYAMTIVQLATCALLTGLISFGQGYEAPVNLSGWIVIFYTAVICTAIAFVVQTWSQAHMSTSKVAVILTMEVVFAAIFAIIFGGEHLTLQATLGGLMVLTAMFIIVLKEN